MIRLLAKKVRGAFSRIFNFTTSNQRHFLRVLLGLSVIFAVCEPAMANNDSVTLDTIHNTIEASTGIVAKILTDIALLAGIGFVLASLFKFHQHKLNPTQVPISQGVTLLMVGAALLIFPMLLSTTTKAVFGDSATPGSGKISSVIKTK